MAVSRKSRSWLKVVGVAALVVVAYDVAKGRTGFGGKSNIGTTSGRTW